MTIFDKFQPLVEARQQIEQSAGSFLNVVMEEIISGTEAIINGRPTILAGSNNYLGLSSNPDCIDAACQAAREEGTGTTGSRMANGTFSGHVALEKELAEYFGRQSAIVFSTGYIANLAMLSTLVGPGEVILLDADCHASITTAVVSVAPRSFGFGTTMRPIWKSAWAALKTATPMCWLWPRVSTACWGIAPPWRILSPLSKSMVLT